MALGEAFTVLAVFEAVDRISTVVEKMDSTLDGFSGTAAKAAETAAAAGAKIDEALLQTASGADALALADARTASAQEKLTAATEAQAQAETALLEARAAAASEEELAAAADALTVAQDRATASTTELKAAQDALGAATKAKASEVEIAAATDAVAAAQQRATAATAELTAAQESQAALVAPSDIAAAATALTAAEKNATAATTEVTAAQERQASVQRATALATDEGRAAADAATAAQERQVLVQKQAADGAAALQKGMALAAIGVAAVGYESVKAAGNFESMTEHLVTDAGESQQNIGMIRSGMLDLATATGTTTDQMAAGMYHIESAGFHGQKALDVLKTAAEGAKVGGADLDTIGQALTGTMNAFGPSAGTATQMMNAMIATVGAGDMKMQDLGSSLGNVAAIAASAGLQYSQVGGAIATMTAQNVTAQRATQDLAHTIGSLGNPSAVQIKEMTAMGINSTDLSKNLGKAGLTGTFDQLVQAIANNTKGGSVFVTSLNASKAAGAQAQQILAQMPPTMAKVAQSWQAGTTSTADFNKAIGALPPSQKLMYTQFESLTKKSSDFATSLQANTPMAQTFNASLAKMTGGTTSLNTILMLTGQHAGAFADNVKTIGDAAAKSGSSVDNWDKIQGTFNQKMDVVKASVEAAGISIGTVLLPVVSKVASVIANVIGPMATWIASHQKWVGLALAVAGGITVMVAAMKAWEIVQTVINVLTAIFAAEEGAILSPIELVVIAIAALAAGLYYAWGHFKTFREVVTVTFLAVKLAAIDVWHALETAWTAIADAAITVGHALEAAWNAIVGAVETAGHAIETAWNAVASFMTAVWDAVVSAAEAVGGALAAAWQSVVSAVATVWHAIETAWKAVENVTSTVFGAIHDFFKKWWPLLLVIFFFPIAVLVSAWNHFHEQIEATAKTAWGAISGFLESVWGDIKSVAQGAWDGIKTYIITPLEDLWQEIETLWHDVENFLVGIWHDIQGAAETAWGFIKTTATNDWGLIKTYIIQPMEEVWAEVQHLWNVLMDWLSVMWIGIKSDAILVWHAIKSAIVTPLTDAWHSVTGIIGNIGSDIWNGLMSAWHTVEHIGDSFVSIGENIVNGIISGVENAGSALFKTLGNLASDALKSAKSFLGINSPSKVFADQVGSSIPEGIAKGVTDNAHLAHAAVTRLSASLPLLPAGSGSPAFAGVGAAGGGLPFVSAAAGASGGGPNVYIDMRGATAMGNGAMNQLAQTIGNQLTKQLAPAGVHIRG